MSGRVGTRVGLAASELQGGLGRRPTLAEGCGLARAMVKKRDLGQLLRGKHHRNSTRNTYTRTSYFEINL